MGTLTLKETDLLPIKVGGEVRNIPWKEAQTGFQFHADYTRKMQELASQRQAWEAEKAQLTQSRSAWETERQQYARVLSDPNALQALWQRAAMAAQPQNQAPQPLTTETLPSLRDAIRKELMAEVQGEFQNFHRSQLAAQNEAVFSGHVKTLLASSPQLAALEGLDEAIAAKVIALQPKSMDEAKNYAGVIVETYKRAQKEASENEAKQAALARSQANNGIEPRGGQAVLPNLPQNFKRLEDLDDAFLEYLNQTGG